MMLEAPRGSDEEGYRELLLSPQVNRWLRPPPAAPFIDPDPGLWLARDITHWRRHGFGPWVLADRESHSFIGRCGLSYVPAENGRHALELSWAIVPSRWGEGLATEAALVAMDAAAGLGADEVLAFTLEANHASRRVIEKIGLAPAGEVKRAGLPHLAFALPVRRL